jgi:hypothetical protein
MVRQRCNGCDAETLYGAFVNHEQADSVMCALAAHKAECAATKVRWLLTVAMLVAIAALIWL